MAGAAVATTAKAPGEVFGGGNSISACFELTVISIFTVSQDRFPIPIVRNRGR